MAYIFGIIVPWAALYWLYSTGWPSDHRNELLILLPLPPECWDYRLGLPHVVYVVLRSQPTVLYMPGNCFSIHWRHVPSPWVSVDFLESDMCWSCARRCPSSLCTYSSSLWGEGVTKYSSSPSKEGKRGVCGSDNADVATVRSWWSVSGAHSSVLPTSQDNNLRIFEIRIKSKHFKRGKQGH